MEPVKPQRTVVLDAFAHQNEPRIALKFPYDSELIATAKTLGARWSNTLKVWHLPKAADTVQKVFAA